jgi:hypothetical protein
VFVQQDCSASRVPLKNLSSWWKEREEGVFDETSKEDGIYVNGIRMIVILSIILLSLFHSSPLF